MNKWVLTRISEMADIISGGTPKTEISEYWNGNIPWLSVRDFSGDAKYVYSSEKSITELGLNNSSTQLLFPGDIIISARGTVGEIAQLGKTMAFNQSCYGLRAKNGYSPNFLYYVLKYQVKYLKAVANGAVFDTIILKTFDKMKSNIPQFSLQQKIADILSTYDDLIEANNRRIELLEQAAQELYKEWFVRFRFPGYEKVKFEDGLPKGWKRDKIQIYYNTCSGGTPSRSKPEYFENGLYPWVKTGEIKDCVIIDTEEYITQEAVYNSSTKILPAKSVVMAMYGVNIGLLAYFDGEMTCNQACCVFSDKRNFSSKHYLYHYLKSIREYLLLISFGAAQQNLSQDLIRKIKITMPTDDIVILFEKKIDEIYNNIRILLVKNKNLIAQRDLLLPRLMSGKLEV